MNDSSKKFFIVLAVVLILSISFGLYKIFILKDFEVFINEEDIPGYFETI